MASKQDLLFWIKIEEDVGTPSVQMDWHQCLVSCSEVLDALCTCSTSKLALQVCMKPTLHQWPAPSFPSSARLVLGLDACFCVLLQMPLLGFILYYYGTFLVILWEGACHILSLVCLPETVSVRIG